ncbi:MAG: IS1 family transposase [Leptolyngbya sp. SIO1D8]|nr:IS1 family transposase [Leptolyngbya sp. SIO1D8]
MLMLTHLLEDAKCYETVRRLRWPEGIVHCPKCGSAHIVKRGKDENQPHRQRYACKSCNRQFDDLSGTIFAGRHRPLKVWIACLYLMGLELSNHQIARQLDLDNDAVQTMTTRLQQAIEEDKVEVQLLG